MSQPRIMSLCSGYGGLDMAAEHVTGGVTIAFAEYDDDPSKIIAHHWPDVPNLRDVKNIDWDAWAGIVDIVTAGYPCQPFSHAGKRAGENDPRHLWPNIAAGIRVVRPRLVLLENVGGHLSMGFGRVLGDLAEAGYDARWTCIRAADVGAPHGRARVFIAATPADSQSNARWFAHGDRQPAADADCERSDGRGLHGPGERWRAEPAHRGVTAAHADVDTAEAVGFTVGVGAEHAQPGGGLNTVPDTSSDGRHERRAEPAGQLGRPHAAQCGGAVVPDTEGERQEGVRLGVTSGGQACGGRVRDAAGDAGGVEWGAYGPAIHRWEAVTARPAPRPTEPGRNGRERLSPRFVEWMMGLPAGHVTDVPGLSRNAQLKALGNGVVIQQAAAAYRILLSSMPMESAA